MTRPLYETTADRTRESEVADVLCERWRCWRRKLPIAYGLDYALGRERRVCAFMEIKVRNYSLQRIDELGGLMLSLAKWERARSLNKATGFPFSLAVGVSDGIFTATFRTPSCFDGFPVAWGGRTDRYDWQDKEPIVLIETQRFKLVQQKEIAA